MNVTFFEACFKLHTASRKTTVFRSNKGRGGIKLQQIRSDDFVLNYRKNRILC